MKKYLNRVAVNTATEGTGTLSLGSAISNAFLTPDQAGGENDDVVSYVIQEGTNFEIGTGTLNIAGDSLTRDEVYISKINGSASQTKMDLSGSAVVRLIAAAEDYIRTPDSVTPLSPVWFNTDDGNELGMGDVITPSEITVDQHDYEPTDLETAVMLRVSSNDAHTITGLEGGASQREITFANVGSNNIVLADESGSSSAANRFALGDDLTLQPGAAVRLVYDGTSNRWRAFGTAAPGGRLLARYFIPHDADPGDLPAHVTKNAADEFEYTPQPGLKFLIVRVQASGGPGGNSVGTSSGEVSAGAGGGEGGFAELLIEAEDLNSPETLTVGGTEEGASFGSHVSATAGSSGESGASSTNIRIMNGGAPGAGVGGDMTVSGSPGQHGWSSGTNDSTSLMCMPGHGASSRYGGGGRGNVISGSGPDSADGGDGDGYGSGGGGGATKGGGGGSADGGAPGPSISELEEWG